MPILAVCGCGRRLRASSRLAGRRVVCPDCGTAVPVPAGSPSRASWFILAGGLVAAGLIGTGTLWLLDGRDGHATVARRPDPEPAPAPAEKSRKVDAPVAPEPSMDAPEADLDAAMEMAVPISSSPPISPSPPPPPSSSPSGQQVDFENTVLPILKARCFSCHQAEREENGRKIKPKAGLRLDGRGWIAKGGDNGRVVIPRQPDKSPIFTRVALPVEHDDHMPPKGDPLTPRQIEVIRKWVAQGAQYGVWTGAKGGIITTAEATAAHPPMVSDRVTLLQALGKGVSPPPEAAVKKAEEAGARLEPAVPGSPLLRVSFTSHEARTTDEQVALLAPFADRIAILDLGRTKITDATADVLSRCRRLTRLELDGTSVTDKTVAGLAALKQLRWLNLFGTAVTDAGVKPLAGLKELRAIYLRETKVTPAGVKALSNALPDARVSYQFEAPAPPQGGEGNARRRR